MNPLVIERGIHKLDFKHEEHGELVVNDKDLLDVIIDVVCRSERFDEPTKRRILIGIIHKMVFYRDVNYEDIPQNELAEIFAKYRYAIVRLFKEPKHEKRHKDLKDFLGLTSKQLCELLSVIIFNDANNTIRRSINFWTILENIAGNFNISEMEKYLKYQQNSDVYPSNHVASLTQSIDERYKLLMKQYLKRLYALVVKFIEYTLVTDRELCDLYVGFKLIRRPNHPVSYQYNASAIALSGLRQYIQLLLGGNNDMRKLWILQEEWNIINIDSVYYDQFFGLSRLEGGELSPRKLPTAVNIHPQILVNVFPVFYPVQEKFTIANHGLIKRLIGKALWSAIIVRKEENLQNPNPSMFKKVDDEDQLDMLGYILDKTQDGYMEDMNFEIEIEGYEYDDHIITHYDNQGRDITGSLKYFNDVKHMHRLLLNALSILAMTKQIKINLLNFISFVMMAFSDPTETKLFQCIKYMRVAFDNGADFRDCYPHPITVFIISELGVENESLKMRCISKFMETFPGLDISSLNNECVINETGQRVGTIFYYLCTINPNARLISLRDNTDKEKVIAITHLINGGMNPIKICNDSPMRSDLAIRHLDFVFFDESIETRQICIELFRAVFSYIFRIRDYPFDVLVSSGSPQVSDKPSLMTTIITHYYWMINDIIALLNEFRRMRPGSLDPDPSIDFSLNSFLSWPIRSALMEVIDKYENPHYYGFGHYSYPNIDIFENFVSREFVESGDRYTEQNERVWDNLFHIRQQKDYASLHPVLRKIYILITYLKSEECKCNILTGKYSVLQYILTLNTHAEQKIQLTLMLDSWAEEDVKKWDGLIWNNETTQTEFPWSRDDSIKINPLIYISGLRVLEIRVVTLNILNKASFYINEDEHYTIFHQLFVIYYGPKNRGLLVDHFISAFLLLNLYLNRTGRSLYEFIRQKTELEDPLYGGTSIVDLYRNIFPHLEDDPISLRVDDVGTQMMIQE